VDVDAYVAAHAPTWDRLDVLARRARRPRRLSGAEIDELVACYRAAATHLSVIASRAPDPVLMARLSGVVARGRSAVAGASAPAWRDLGRFFTVTFPVVVYRTRRWTLAVAAVFIVVSIAFATWVATHPHVQSSIATPTEVRQLVNHDFRDYYSSHPATDFAAQVWTNNALVAAMTLTLGIFLGLPTLLVLLENAANVGVDAGFMAAGHKLGLFFGLVLPHGMLELSAVFIAAGTGLRLGWTVFDPGPRSRTQAIAEEGRSAFTVALGLIAVLLVSGVLEAFLTPSGLPTWARIGIGGVVEAAFIGYVAVVGGRAARAGETGDLEAELRGDVVPVAG
jgi:uncharacterized membrane protein SpoIIM required for sporulation